MSWFLHSTVVSSQASLCVEYRSSAQAIRAPGDVSSDRAVEKEGERAPTLSCGDVRSKPTNNGKIIFPFIWTTPEKLSWNEEGAMRNTKV